MIGKITTGRGAGGVTAYVMGPGENGTEDRAQILASTWSGSPETWAGQIHEHQQAERPGFGDGGAATVLHVSLNAAPGEKLSDDQWRAVAHAYLEKMGWGEHDHAVIRHTDTQHDHVHLVIDRVGRDGQIADLHKDFERQERALDGIERDFGLERTHEQLRENAERNPFAAVESVTRSHLTFERAGIDRYFERLGFEPEKTRELTDRAMRDERVLFASSAGVADKFTTREVQAEVQKLDAALHQLAGQEARPTLDRGAGAREGLDAGQRAAADRIAAGGGLTVVEGLAGAGKSTMLREAGEDLRFSGYDVIGVAPSGKAAAGLEQSAGIESNTLSKTLMQIESGERKITANTVVIVDEAGMARNDELGRLAQHVAAAGGRLVLVGDERQLGAVGRGGGFAEAREIVQGQGGAARLDEIHRQKEDWQRDASKAFGEGRGRDALQSYIDHGNVEWAASRGTARNMLVSDYMREWDRGTAPNGMLALAHENKDVKAMNAQIRDAIKERGGLQNERVYKLEGENGKTQRLAVAVGDRVVFERNNARSGEKNGEFGTVTKTDRRGFDVRMDGEHGRTMRVEDGGKHQMSHGYASTIHKSQGSTIDKVFALASKGMDAALSYVGLSRQREDVKLYANHTEFKDADHMKNSMARGGGREAFKSVRGAGDGREEGKEKGRGWDAERAGKEADARAADRAGKDWGKDKGVERQPVASYITSLLFEQRKAEPFPELQRGQEKSQIQEKRLDQRAQEAAWKPAQERGHPVPAREQPAQGQGQARGQKEQQERQGRARGQEGQRQEKGKGQEQDQRQGQEKEKPGKAEGKGESKSKSRGYGM